MEEAVEKKTFRCAQTQSRMGLDRSHRAARVSLVFFVLTLVGAFPHSAAAQANPDFDAAAWTPLGCDASPLTAFSTRHEVDLVGDATFPAAYMARSDSYLFLRYRVDGDPAGTRGFAGTSDWTTLLQVPSGNAFQYQYQLSVNGDSGAAGDTVEIWANGTPEDLSFDPLFTDATEAKIFSQVYNAADATSGNTTPLARSLQTTDGSSFGGDPDYFVDVAFPIAVLVAKGVIATPSDLDQALFWPATASLPNRHNKDNLSCPFVPATALAVTGTVTPSLIGANATTAVSYTITAKTSGASAAKGVVIGHTALASFMTNVNVTVSADDGVTWTVVAQDPLEVRVPILPPGATVTVRVDADAAPGCGTMGVPSTASARATNAAKAIANILLQAGEVCDGIDNDCNGATDEGGTALCSDGHACNGAEVCAGAAGCQPGPPLDCDDQNVCTTDSCDDTVGCVHDALSGCESCSTAADCTHGNGCTTASCDAGKCTYTPVADCTPCSTAAQCNDGDACTDDVCNASGVCENQPRPGCVLCTLPSDCDDANPCTADQCGIDGSCARTVIPGCVACSLDAQCNDGNACTTDACRGGVCAHDAIPGCTPCIPTGEVCGDGIDNDCDGLTDCSDPDCAGAPACRGPTPEVCGNCVDDDGDGLLDGDDPDCCAESMPLAVSRFLVRPPEIKVRGDRLRLATTWAAATPPLFDPLRQDTSIEIADAGGTLFCTTIGGAHWKRGHRLSYRFTDRSGAFAGGLQTGEFRITRNGNLLFTTRGRGMTLRSPVGGTLRVSVRVGRECSRATMTVRPARKGLVFP